MRIANCLRTLKALSATMSCQGMLLAMHTDKQTILALKTRLKVEPVVVAGLESPIFVRGLNGRERDGFENACFTQRGKTRIMTTENIRAKLLVRAICDEAGARIFSDAEENDLGTIPADILDSLFTVAQKLSGLGASDLEDIAGN